MREEGATNSDVAVHGQSNRLTPQANHAGRQHLPATENLFIHLKNFTEKSY
jgi:hypothetical protein